MPIQLNLPKPQAQKKDIRKLDLQEISQFLTERGEKAFRAKQIYHWLWQKSAQSFEQMTNLSQGLRTLLEDEFAIYPVKITQKQHSQDGTIKCGFELYDKKVVEGVLIPTDTRMTACISSQVGCSLSCKFCATGYLDKKRNLEAPEIYDQVVHIKKLAETTYKKNLSNIVYMGMGEPLLNFRNVLQSIDYITSPTGLNMSPKRITVSTAGIAKMIKKLADKNVKFNLALSLHAANDEKRHQIMPINDSNNLDVLIKSLKYFYLQTRNKITFEYIAFNNFNDSLKDAEELYNLTKHFPVRVNIIEYNQIEEADFEKTTTDKLDKFANYLERKGVTVTVRRSRGKDIDAACGQLANKHNISNE